MIHSCHFAVKTIDEFLSLNKFPDRVFINLVDSTTFAFPIMDYPITADGSYWNSFPFTYIHKSPYGIPYWNNVHDVGLVKLNSYVSYVKNFIVNPTTSRDIFVPITIAPFVFVKVATLELYFEPLNPTDSAIIDGTV
jgi:hypothetical protein